MKELTPGCACDCDQPNNPDPAYHASDCVWRRAQTEPLVRCECGCGKWSVEARLEFNHPEDYRYERG